MHGSRANAKALGKHDLILENSGNRDARIPVARISSSVSFSSSVVAALTSSKVNWPPRPDDAS
jgi:hypothetical protein